jgi:hypothetical protein
MPACAALLLASAGARAEEPVNAAQFGFHAEDSTAALQAAIDSGAKTVVVPYMGEPWIVRPIKLRGNLELIFNPGVLVLAKKGEFQGTGDSLFTASGVENLVIRGYGATLRMRKRDYQNPPYKKGEWRMGIGLANSRHVLVEGVRIESSGGDGIYVDGGEDVTIRNIVSHDNHRQGVSVISVKHLRVENSVFSGTRGTAPEAGIDLEPDTANQRLVDCVIRNCVFENNHGHAILVYLNPLRSTSAPVSIRFENCLSRMGSAGMTVDDFKDMSQGGWAGMAVGASRDDGPRGLVEFINCTAENTGKEGARVFDKSASGVRVRFVNCSWRNPWISAHRDASEPRVPILIQLRRPKLTVRQGGVEFVDCHVYDFVARPALMVDEEQSNLGVSDLHGQITVHGPGPARMKLGPKVEASDLQAVPPPK